MVKELLPAETDLGAPCYRHNVELSGLEPNTEYFYGFPQDDGGLTANEPLSFRTACPGALSFLAFGDSGSGSAEQQILAGWMKTENPSLVLHLGDLAYPRGSFQDFQAYYFDPCHDLMKRVPFFPCPGNHDYMTRDAFPYLALHDMPQVESVPESDRGRYYSLTGVTCTLFPWTVTPPGAGGRRPGAMLDWLENDLRATRQYWKIVYFHHPPFAGGPNENDPLSELARRYLVPIIERHGVQLVLNGHEHSYQRTYPFAGKQTVKEGKGTVYVTSGGGGYGLYAAHPNPLVAVRHVVASLSPRRCQQLPPQGACHRSVGRRGRRFRSSSAARSERFRRDSSNLRHRSARVLKIHGGTSRPWLNLPPEPPAFRAFGDFSYGEWRTLASAQGVPHTCRGSSHASPLEGRLALEVTTPNGVAGKHVRFDGPARDSRVRKCPAESESFHL